MANEEHVALLKQGIHFWNSWWVEHGKAFHELIGATRTDADLSEANLRGADLHGAFLSGANLRGARSVRKIYPSLFLSLLHSW